MFKQNIGKRSKEDYILTRKSKDRKEIINDHLPSTSHIPTQSGSSSYVPEVVGNGQQNDIIYSGSNTGKTTAIILGGAAGVGFLIVLLLLARKATKKDDDY